MALQNKLQVFVSSTYSDLHEARQAAVEAILTAGHIPAGMELFAAGDESQMATIRRWIDDSDAFLLILGGRYGSIEPTSGKSYIHLEYEYALAQAKPVFAVVISEEYRKERVHQLGEDAIETQNPSKLKDFRAEVLSRIVKFWSDPRDIKLAIMETMADFSRRPELVGWVRSDQMVNTASLAEELARLARENSELRATLSKRTSEQQTYNGLLFQELVLLLSEEPVVTSNKSDSREDSNYVRDLMTVCNRAKSSAPTLLQALWVLRERIVPKAIVGWAETNVIPAIQRLQYYGFLKSGVRDEDGTTYEVTTDGQKFILRLFAERHSVHSLGLGGL